MRIEPKFTEIEVPDETLSSSSTAPASPHRQPPVPRVMASPGRRYVGQMLDGIVAFAIIFALFAVGKALALEQNHIDILALGSGALYWIFADALPRGQSLGKRVLNMAVIDKDTGAHCSLWQSFLRNILTPIIGVIDAVFILTRKRQRIGDLAANTIVVKY